MVMIASIHFHAHHQFAMLPLFTDMLTGEQCTFFFLFNVPSIRIRFVPVLASRPHDTIMTREGKDGQVCNSNARATGYILCVEKTGSELF